VGSSVRLVGAAVALAAAVTSCATYSDRTDLARDAVQAGNVKAGVRELNRFLKVRASEDLPRKWKKDMELVVLERASMLQALGLYELSSRDFEVADSSSSTSRATAPDSSVSTSTATARRSTRRRRPRSCRSTR
jgi:hypothetical protein